MNPKFTCPRGRPALKCCILSSCMKPPMMCASDTCQCQTSHLLCFRQCKLSLILNQVSKDIEPNKKIFDQICGYYDRILKIVSDEKQEFINSILNIKERELEKNQKEFIELIKGGREGEISCRLLGEMVEEVRRNVEKVRESGRSGVRSGNNGNMNGKDVVSGVERRVKGETKKIRILWDQNAEKEIKLREKLQECKIVDMRIDGKKNKLKGFQVQQITEIHLQTITEEVIELMSDLCSKLSTLYVIKEIPIDTLQVFKNNVHKFKKLGRFHTGTILQYSVNNVSQQWKNQAYINNFLQVIHMDSSSTRPQGSSSNPHPPSLYPWITHPFLPHQERLSSLFLTPIPLSLNLNKEHLKIYPHILPQKPKVDEEQGGQGKMKVSHHIGPIKFEEIDIDEDQ